jgi:hypothetical protein
MEASALTRTATATAPVPPASRVNDARIAIAALQIRARTVELVPTRTVSATVHACLDLADLTVNQETAVPRIRARTAASASTRTATATVNARVATRDRRVRQEIAVQ